MGRIASKQLRFEVFKRDCFTCRYCGRKPPEVVLHADHILAWASGGATELENLVTACQDCNAGKSNRPLSALKDPLDLSVEGRAERLEQLKAYERQLSKEREYRDLVVERLMVAWCKRAGLHEDEEEYTIVPEIVSGIVTFLKKNLTAGEILESMDIAFDRWGKSWRTEKYFFGVCWKKIRDKAEATENVRQTIQSNS